MLPNCHKLQLNPSSESSELLLICSGEKAKQISMPHAKIAPPQMVKSAALASYDASIREASPFNAYNDANKSPARDYLITPQSPNLPPPPASPSSRWPGFRPNTFQNRRVSSPAPVTTTRPSGLMARYSTR